jgi:type IV pilus biogenesis protein CpaD/CtpE
MLAAGGWLCLLVLLAVAVAGLTSCASKNPKNCDLPPSISSLSPVGITAGGPQFTLTVNGDFFFVASVVQWNEGDRQTTIVNANQATAVILASDIANPGTAEVRVTTPYAGSNNIECIGESESLRFTINPPVP